MLQSHPATIRTTKIKTLTKDKYFSHKFRRKLYNELEQRKLCNDFELRYYVMIRTKKLCNELEQSNYVMN